MYPTQNSDLILLKMLQAKIQHPLKKYWNIEAKFILNKVNLILSFEETTLLPSAQAAGPDPFRCNSTNRRNPPLQQNSCNF